MPLMRGAILSPRHKLAAAVPHQAGPAPESFFKLAAMPLPMWGNDFYGDCVTAEEFSAKAADGHLGTDSEAVNAARTWGGLNGADLSTFLHDAAQGFTVGGQVLADGPAQTVNYTDWPSLTSAISQGQVKIAVAASQLQSNGAGGGKVWFMLSASIDSGIDHCVGLSGYGTLIECCEALNVPTPTSADLTTPCVVMETWGGYGIVSYSACLAVMGSTPTAGNSEAWLRVPTTVVPPAPPPGPNPTPPTPGPTWRAAELGALAARLHALGGVHKNVVELTLSDVEAEFHTHCQRHSIPIR